LSWRVSGRSWLTMSSTGEIDFARSYLMPGKITTEAVVPGSVGFRLVAAFRGANDSTLPMTGDSLSA
jgi:hypothetical protein